MEGRRLVADRFQRIWRLVEHIAREPGRTRQELARAFSLSERQVQADLNVIRTEMRLPLIRRQGYRFSNKDGGQTGSLELAEAQLVLLLIRQAQAEKTVPADQLNNLMRKLPTLLPSHLQPLLDKIIQSGPSRKRQRQHFETVTRAILKGSTVKLHYPRGASSPLVEPEIKPAMLLPYKDSWYLIGMCRQRNRLMMFELDTADAVKDG